MMLAGEGIFRVGARILCAAALGLACGASAQAQDLDAQQEARYRALTQELRCLVCQNQNIADSNAPLADDLRQQVKGQILAGKSDADILGYLTSRYGDFVLYRPRFQGNTWLLWLAPLLLAIGGVVVAVRIARRQRAPAQIRIDRAALDRLLKPEKPR